MGRSDRRRGRGMRVRGLELGPDEGRQLGHRIEVLRTHVRLLDLEGNQAVDTLFYSAKNPRERYDPQRTLRKLAIQTRRKGRRPTWSGAAPAGGGKMSRWLHCWKEQRRDWPIEPSRRK